MNAPVQPVPEGYHTVTPYLVVPDAPAVLDFIEEAFGGQTRSRNTDADGQIIHAEIQVGDSMIMLGQSSEEWPPTRAMIHLYLPDVDGVYARALDAGARSLRQPEDMFYGDRSGGVEDPWGTQWWIATHVEDVSMQEMERRQAEGWP